MKRYLSKQAFKDGITTIKVVFNSFMNDMALKFSASLAYYTIFSLAPLLLLVISLTGFFLGKDAIQGQLFKEINGFVGDNAARQIQDIITQLQLSGKSTTLMIINVATLVLSATTVLGEIRESINIIWQVKVKSKRARLKLIEKQLLSGSLIISLGFLLLVSLLVNGAMLAFSDKLETLLPDITIMLFNVMNVVVSFIIITLLFGVILKVFPDVNISWREVRFGIIFIAILFMLGRLVIGIYLSMSADSSTYGAAGCLIAILLWIYYTAAILYFAAAFTKAYINFEGKRIRSADYPVHVEPTEVEKR